MAGPRDARGVASVLRDAADLVRWWPSVYLDVEVVEPGRPDGLGRVVSLRRELDRRRLGPDAAFPVPPPGRTFAWLVRRGARVATG